MKVARSIFFQVSHLFPYSLYDVKHFQRTVENFSPKYRRTEDKGVNLTKSKMQKTKGNIFDSSTAAEMAKKPMW